jgi:hypothetical protein
LQHDEQRRALAQRLRTLRAFLVDMQSELRSS